MLYYLHLATSHTHNILRMRLFNKDYCLPLKNLYIHQWGLFQKFQEELWPMLLTCSSILGSVSLYLYSTSVLLICWFMRVTLLSHLFDVYLMDGMHCVLIKISSWKLEYSELYQIQVYIILAEFCTWNLLDFDDDDPWNRRISIKISDVKLQHCVLSALISHWSSIDLNHRVN